MHIDKVSYQKTFNLGNYQSEKIEVCLVLNEGENATLALDTARQLVEEYHLKSNPPEQTFTKIVAETLATRPKDVEGGIIHDINTCTDIKVLETYKLLLNKYPKAQDAYNQKLKTLQ